MSVGFVLYHGPYQPMLDEQLSHRPFLRVFLRVGPTGFPTSPLIDPSAIHRRAATHQPVNGCDPVCIGVSEPALLVLAGAWYLAQYSISVETSQRLGL